MADHLHNETLRGTFWPRFKIIRPVVLEEMRYQEMFTDGQLDEQTNAGEFPDRKKTPLYYVQKS